LVVYYFIKQKTILVLLVGVYFVLFYSCYLLCFSYYAFVSILLFYFITLGKLLLNQLIIGFLMVFDGFGYFFTCFNILLIIFWFIKVTQKLLILF